LRIFLVYLMIFFCYGCVHTISETTKNDPVYKAILGCTAGILSGYEADFEASLNKAKLDFKSEAEINSYVKGYIFENLPEADRLRAYEHYLKCFHEQTHPQDLNNTTQLMINSPSGVQIGGDLIVNPKTSDPIYKPLLGKKRIEIVNQLVSVKENTSNRPIKISVYVETGNTGRIRVARDLVNIFEDAGFETEGPSTGTTYWSNNGIPPAISVTHNPDDLQVIKNILLPLTSFLNVTFKGKQRKEVERGHYSIAIYGEPLFADDGSVTFP